MDIFVKTWDNKKMSHEISGQGFLTFTIIATMNVKEPAIG